MPKVTQKNLSQARCRAQGALSRGSHCSPEQAPPGFWAFPLRCLETAVASPTWLPPHGVAARKGFENSDLISLCHSLPSFEKKEGFSSSKETVNLLGMTFRDHAPRPSLPFRLTLSLCSTLPGSHHPVGPFTLPANIALCPSLRPQAFPLGADEILLSLQGPHRITSPKKAFLTPESCTRSPMSELMRPSSSSPLCSFPRRA